MLVKLLESMLGEKWGVKVFVAALVVSILFFWWLLIYSHGVTPQGH